MHLELLTKQVCNLSRSVGSYVRDELNKVRKSDIEEKDKNSFVTYVDKEAENRLVSELSKLVPGAGFIAEENDQLKKSEDLNWIIDPLDGTTNFIHGIPFFAISIALMEKSHVVLGVVYEISTQEIFYAWKDSPAYFNRDEIHVSQTESLNNALFATGFPYYDYSRLEEYIEVFKNLLKNTRGLRRMGSAALDLAYVAAGRFDGFYEYGLHPWDVAAGSFIVQQAGGKVTDFNSNNDFIFGKEIFASNAKIHEKVIKIISEKFNK